MRLVTRGDLDGLTAAVLITEMEEIESIELIHPQDITDNKYTITENDIMANLPYHPKCAIWFDHHQLTESNPAPPDQYNGKHEIAPSVARVIYDYYSSEKLRKYEKLVDETDRFDAAHLSMKDVTNPEGVILLGYTIDSRTGLGSFKDYFVKLVIWLRTMAVDEILLKPDVVERIEIMKAYNASFLEILKEHSRLDGSVVITDFRSLKKPPVGNRFLVYTLFPEATVSIRLQRGPNKEFIATSVGHNIFNRSSNANCGEICSQFSGGGHVGAGAVPLKTDLAEKQIIEIAQLLKDAG